MTKNGQRQPAFDSQGLKSMPDLSKIQPAQRILPTLQDQHVIRKKDSSEEHKKKQDSEPENKQDRKVDEYI